MSKMPVLFVGHGSPMNAVEDNVFSQTWRKLGENIPRPQAILVISAHWYVPGRFVSDAENPRQIYDMYGFPQPLYDLIYPAKGSPQLAARAAMLCGATIQNDWGIDHGTWSVLVHLFPDATIPVVQLSVDRTASPGDHFALGQQLSALRDEGVLILGSGNIVHNLRRVNFSQPGGEAWAERFDQLIREHIEKRDFQALLEPKGISADAELAIPTPDHYWPLLPILGASDPNDQITVFNQTCQFGSLSMTGYYFFGG